MPKHSEHRRAQWRKANQKRRKDPVYCAEQYERQKRWQELNRERLRPRMAELMREKYTKDPRLRPRHEARWIVNRRIASGKLKREPCEVCGAIQVEAHHDDYSKPLEVRWLCHTHHREHHKAATGE